MSLFHKIRLSLNVATEGLQRHLRCPGLLVMLNNVTLNYFVMLDNVIPGSTRD